MHRSLARYSAPVSFVHAPFWADFITTMVGFEVFGTHRLVGTLLRYPYEVRSEEEYFDEIQDVKVTKDMLDLAKHIVNQKSGRFEPDRFEDHYETALVDLINSKRSGKPITPKERPRGENVVDLMDALRKSVGGATADTKAPKKGAKKPRKAAAGQKEMLMPIAGKKPKEAAAKKPAARSQLKAA
jgi:DNA end-binding protein Ku